MNEIAMKIYKLQMIRGISSRKNYAYEDVGIYTSLEKALKGAEEQCGHSPIRILELKANEKTGMFIGVDAIEMHYDKKQKCYHYSEEYYAENKYPLCSSFECRTCEYFNRANRYCNLDKKEK